MLNVLSSNSFDKQDADADKAEEKTNKATVSFIFLFYSVM